MELNYIETDYGEVCFYQTSTLDFMAVFVTVVAKTYSIKYFLN